MVEILVRPDQRTDAISIGGSPRARAWTLPVACMGVALVVASMTALNTALGDLAVATSATQTQLSWVVDGYTLALACLLLPVGAIGDRYGRRGALLAGLVVFALGSGAPAILHNPLQIIAGRAVAGIGAAPERSSRWCSASSSSGGGDHFWMFGMQYVQQIMGYSPLATAFSFGPFIVQLGIFSVDGGWFRVPVPTEPAHLVLRIYLADIDTCHWHRNMHGGDDFGDHGLGAAR
ncbi:MAG TPA: MFS transporter [Mycobacterium sp.]|nr:MFS transporter [Mycobacterium sp.]